jgi:hypothetical protein
MFVMACVAVFAGWYAWKKLPDWSRSAMVSVVEQSDLPPDQKRRIVVQIDRLVGEYKAGRVNFQQLQQVAEEFSESPLFGLLMVLAASEKYIEPSGLSADEKNDARIAMQRVARGVYEKLITPDKIEPLLDFVSRKDSQGNRQFETTVSDENLKNMIAECRRLADDAKVPEGAFEIDAAAEVEKAVDRAISKPAP